MRDKEPFRFFMREGKYHPKDLRTMPRILIDSYKQISSYSHSYITSGDPCPPPENPDWIGQSTVRRVRRWLPIKCMSFDHEGKYLAYTTRGGCLTILDSLHLQSKGDYNEPLVVEAKYQKHIVHNPVPDGYDALKWSPIKQEVACVSTTDRLGFGNPVKRLHKKDDPLLLATDGMSDIVFSSDGLSILASDSTSACVYLWDSRESALPTRKFSANSDSFITSIDGNDQMILGSDNNGVIHVWDIRSGKNPIGQEGFQSSLDSFVLAELLRKAFDNPIKQPPEQIQSQSICSIDINPECKYQLGFQLRNGWSGVLNVLNFMRPTHLHCPPPFTMQFDRFTSPAHKTRATWMPNSIYTLGSMHTQGVYFLDFHPELNREIVIEARKLLPLKSNATACVAHTSSANLVVGTENGELLVVSENRRSIMGDF